MTVQRTRAQLVDVARQLFAKKGVEETTMNDIAVASKKGRRTLYTYFKSKDQIYLAVVESVPRRLFSLISLTLCLLFQILPQIFGQCLQFLHPVRQAGFAHRRLKAAAQCRERKVRVLHPFGSSLLQHLRQGGKGILLFQKSDCLQRLRIGAGRFAKVCRITVGLSVGLVAHLFEGF